MIFYQKRHLVRLFPFDNTAYPDTPSIVKCGTEIVKTFASEISAEEREGFANKSYCFKITTRKNPNVDKALVIDEISKFLVFSVVFPF